MRHHSLVIAACMTAFSLPVSAEVSAEEAAQLKTTLTPMGAERAGNKEGTIPAWTGGYTTPPAGFKAGQRRPDPYAADKPLYSITAKNMDQYADKLSDGYKAMLKRYPDFRIDVYPTRRSAAAPQYVYDNTFKNATRAKLVDSADGYPIPSGAFGGAPFPIPKSGIEVVWNHLLRFQGEATVMSGGQVWMVTADGKKLMTVEGQQEIKMPYYDPKGSAEKFDGLYWLTRVSNVGPAIRAGEAIVGRVNLEESKTNSYVYLTGQRRVRKLPNAFGDTPTPTSAGVATFDEVNVFAGNPGLFDWKLVGKKEMLVPYNSYKTLEPTSADPLLTAAFINPDYMRWELHRVWVVDAELKPGKRHSTPKARYYFDEDSWMGVMGDRWDAKGQLWKTLFGTTVVYPEIPLAEHAFYGFYDLLSGAWVAGPLANQPSKMIGRRAVTELKNDIFTPDGMVGDQLR
jgi:hypothetical protein